MSATLNIAIKRLMYKGYSFKEATNKAQQLLRLSWEESKHPRDHGKFATKNGSKGSNEANKTSGGKKLAKFLLGAGLTAGAIAAIASGHTVVGLLLTGALAVNFGFKLRHIISIATLGIIGRYGVDAYKGYKEAQNAMGQNREKKPFKEGESMEADLVDTKNLTPEQRRILEKYKNKPLGNESAKKFSNKSINQKSKSATSVKKYTNHEEMEKDMNKRREELFKNFKRGAK